MDLQRLVWLACAGQDRLHPMRRVSATRMSFLINVRRLSVLSLTLFFSYGTLNVGCITLRRTIIFHVYPSYYQ